MKKLISIILTIIICFAVVIAGCGKKNPSPPPPLTPTDEKGNPQAQRNGRNDMAGRVVYGRTGDSTGIYSVDLLGRNNIGIYAGQYDMASGDGNRVVFEGFKNGKWSVYALSSDGRTARAVLNDYILDGTAAANPNDNSIAFIGHSNKNSNTGLYYIGANDKTPKKLLDDSTIRDVAFINQNFLIYSKKVKEGDQEIYQMFRYDLRNRAESRVLKSMANDICPTPSPDGKKIAFLSNGSRQYNIYSLNTGNSTVEKINGNDPVVRGTIRWSVNSNDVLYVTLDSDGVYKVRLSRVREKVSMDIGDGYIGAFSPSGTDVVYASYDKVSKRQIINRKVIGQDTAYKVTDFSEPGKYSRSINLLFWTNQFGI